MWTDSDVLTTQDFSLFIDKIVPLTTLYKVSFIPITKGNAQMLYAEELDSIDYAISQMCERCQIPYERKVLRNLTLFSFEDMNRWEAAIEQLKQVALINTPINTEENIEITTESGEALYTDFRNM